MCIIVIVVSTILRRKSDFIWTSSDTVIGTSIVAHCYYTTLLYDILEKGLSIARYAEIYQYASGPCDTVKRIDVTNVPVWLADCYIV